MSAAFELQGDATEGALTLSSPLGTVLAQAHWSVRGGVVWQTGSERTQFENLDALAMRLTGTTLPFSALMDWLHGTPTQVRGWQVNLQEFAQGRISAQRESPSPGATLRIVLDPASTAPRADNRAP